MSIGHLRALRLLHRTFRNHPPGARLHILIRYVTAPFLRTLDLVPKDSRVLDIGAGHGTFARLALEAGAREVVALEPDLRKALLPLRHPGLRVVAGFDDAIRGRFDAVAMLDTMYRIPLPERDALCRRIFDRLQPGGLFLLKELDAGHRWKMKWAQFQEFLSDRLLGLTMGSGFVYESNAQVEERMKRLGFEDFRARKIDFGYPHSHIVYTARKPRASS